MTKEDIIRMALKVGLPHWYHTDGIVNEERVIAFATLVASAEREACAKVCEDLEPEWADQPDFAKVEALTMLDCSLAIRERQWL